MLLLDVTIVSVALADIQRDLSADLAQLQWVVDAYTLTLAGLLLTAATLGDRIGRKRIFVAGLTLFTTASLACALAGDALVLNLLRAVQGIGGAALFGTAVPLLGAAFPTAAGRARAIGAFGATLAAATAVGPLLGGVLVDGPGWRWIFLINVPVGILTLIASLQVRESRPQTAQRADWAGTALLTASLFALLLGLIRGNSDGWGSGRIVFLFAAAAVLLAGFVARELTGREPMLDLRLFVRPAFSGVGLAAFAVSGTLIAATYYIALDLQNGYGFSPIATGLRVLPLTVTSFVAAPVTAGLLRRTGTTVPTVVSLVLAGAGMLLAAQIDPTSSWTVLVPGFVLAGLGLGISSAALTSAALASVEPARAGMATGAVNTLRQVGTAAGVAVLGAVFQHQATERAGALLDAVQLPVSAREQLSTAIGSGAGRIASQAVPEPLRQAVADAGAAAMADALSTVLTAGGVAVLVSAVLCAVLMRRRATDSQVAPQGHPVVEPSLEPAAL